MQPNFLTKQLGRKSDRFVLLVERKFPGAYIDLPRGRPPALTSFLLSSVPLDVEILGRNSGTVCPGGRSERENAAIC